MLFQYDYIYLQCNSKNTSLIQVSGTDIPKRSRAAF